MWTIFVRTICLILFWIFGPKWSPLRISYGIPFHLVSLLAIGLLQKLIFLHVSSPCMSCFEATGWNHIATFENAWAITFSARPIYITSLVGWSSNRGHNGGNFRIHWLCCCWRLWLLLLDKSTSFSMRRQFKVSFGSATSWSTNSKSIVAGRSISKLIEINATSMLEPVMQKA